MGPAVPCGEACPTPSGAGDWGQEEGGSLEEGEGQFPWIPFGVIF